MKTLWRDEAGGRHYLVPDAVDLAPGPLLLRSGATRSVSVDPSAVAPYAVTREEGRAFLDARVDAWAAQTKQEMAGLFSRPDAPAAGAGDTSSSNATSGPGVRLFSALTGQPAEKAETDPQAFVTGLAAMLGQVAAVMQRAGDGPEGEAEARERIRQLGETLRAHGIGPPDPARSE